MGSYQTIDRDRLQELKYFCRQYDSKKREAKDILLSSSFSFDRVPSGNLKRSATETKAIKRYNLLQDIQLIESCARDVDDGAWYQALINNCCRGIAWEFISPNTMRSSQKSAFFDAKKEFFVLLDQRQIVLNYNLFHQKDAEMS